MAYDELELLSRAQQAADWYQLKDIMYDDNGRPYIMVEYEDEDCISTFKKQYLDY